MNSSTFTHKSTPASVQYWRISASNWWVVAFFVAVSLIGAAAMVIVPRSSSAPPDLAVAASIVGMFQIIIIPLSLWFARFVITTDEDGISWRGFGRRRRVPWAQITDYYEVSAHRTLLAVETPVGRFSPEAYVDHKTKLQELKAIIQRKAVCAKASGWALKGTREQDDWPQIFSHRSRDVKVARWIIFGLSIVMSACCLAMVWSGLGRIGETFHLLGPWMGTAFVLLMLFFFGIYPFLFYILSRDRLKSVGEDKVIKVSPEGIECRQGDSRISASWKDVSDYYLLPREKGMSPDRNRVIVTPRGIIEFAAAHQRSELLRAIVSRYATSAATDRWEVRGKPEDRLGDESACWSGGAPGVGQRIYHYRNRTVRAMLWFPAALAVIFWLTPFLRIEPDPAVERNIFDLLIPGLISGLLFSWAWWRYRKSDIRIDDSGITQNTLFGRKYIAWPEVRAFDLLNSDKANFGRVFGPGKTIWFWTAISDVEELKAQIERRAVNCFDKSW